MTKSRKSLLLIALYLATCLVVDLWPQFGPPQFRYTGSDPEVFVWNFGWPLTTFIYDPRSGIHVGPGLYLVVAAQLGLLVVGGACFYVLQRFRRTNLHSNASPLRQHPG
jgi:hypothetical protein